METRQARLYKEQLRESATVQTLIESERGTASASFGNGLAGVTIVDNHLRRSHALLTIEGIDKLIEELKIARAHLEFEAQLAMLPRYKTVG
jgi:hypothetical protein